MTPLIIWLVILSVLTLGVSFGLFLAISMVKDLRGQTQSIETVLDELNKIVGDFPRGKFVLVLTEAPEP